MNVLVVIMREKNVEIRNCFQGKSPKVGKILRGGETSTKQRSGIGYVGVTQA